MDSRFESEQEERDGEVLGRGLPSAFASVGEGLGKQEIHEGGTRSLDLRRQNRLLANEGVQEPIERRNHLARDVQPRQGQDGRYHTGRLPAVMRSEASLPPRATSDYRTLMLPRCQSCGSRSNSW